MSRLQALDVRVVQSSLAMALSLEGALLFPEALSMLLDKSDEFELCDVPLENAKLVDRPLRAIHLPPRALVLPLADTRDPRGLAALRPAPFSARSRCAAREPVTVTRFCGARPPTAPDGRRPA